MPIINKLSQILIVMIFSLNVYGQTLRNYSGKFEDGNATYHYYENEKMDRVMHGSFSYIGSLFDMKGFFIHGNKNGKWEITATNKTYAGWRGSIKLNTKITGEYNNGSLNGNWQYRNSIRFANNSQDDEDKEISTASFFNNHFIGKVTYEANWPVKYIVVGQFDDSGLMSGTWVYTKNKERDEIRFNNGVAYWRLYNDTTTGEKKIFCDNTEFVREFWNRFDPTTQTSLVNGVVYYPDTVFISADTRVMESNGTYADKRIINALKIGDPSMSRDDNYNPICIWLKDNTSVYFAGSLTNPLYYYPKGSIYPFGLQIIINECDRYSECYKQLKKREEEEKVRLEAIAKKEKYDLAVKNGNNLFESKKFKQALNEYVTANSIESSNFISQKIKITKNEISMIDSLQNLRLENYKLIKSGYTKINSEIPDLKLSLAEMKKIYGENYELCMKLLEEKFPQYFSELKEMFSQNKTTGLKVEDTWNEIDQKALIIVLKFQKEFETYEDFHLTVKVAVNIENKDLLKLLKSSSNLNEIINKIIE